MPRAGRFGKGAARCRAVASCHVLSRGHNREALVADPNGRCYSLGLLRRYRRRPGFRLYPDCLMVEHSTLRFDVASSLVDDTAVHFWFGFTHPF